MTKLVTMDPYVTYEIAWYVDRFSEDDISITSLMLSQARFLIFSLYCKTILLLSHLGNAANVSRRVIFQKKKMWPSSIRLMNFWEYFWNLSIYWGRPPYFTYLPNLRITANTRINRKYRAPPWPFIFLSLKILKKMIQRFLFSREV